MRINITYCTYLFLKLNPENTAKKMLKIPFKDEKSRKAQK